MAPLRRLWSTTFFLFAVLAVFLVSISHARAADSLLSGKMTVYSYLLGPAWSCSLKTPAEPRHPSETSTALVSYSVALGNILHEHGVSKDSVGDAYYGFDSKSHKFWQGSVNSKGTHLMLESQSGTAFHGLFIDGMTGGVFRATTVMRKTTNRQFGSHLIAFGKVHSLVEDAVCTR